MQPKIWLPTANPLVQQYKCRAAKYCCKAALQASQRILQHFGTRHFDTRTFWHPPFWLQDILPPRRFQFSLFVAMSFGRKREKRDVLLILWLVNDIMKEELKHFAVVHLSGQTCCVEFHIVKSSLNTVYSRMHFTITILEKKYKKKLLKTTKNC